MIEVEQSVLKFGGTSAAQPELCAQIFCENPDRNRVAVISGIGKMGTGTDEAKVTDLLIGLEHAVRIEDDRAIGQARDAVIDRYRAAYSSLGERALGRLCDSAFRLMNPQHQDDGYEWAGERMSARFFAQLTGAVYVGSALRFTKGKLDVDASRKATAELIYPLLKSGDQVVAEAYFGYYTETAGKVTTLPRGGSDTTGVLYTGALMGLMPGAWVNENYTDKNGILCADPSIIPDAHTVPEMTHEEVREIMHGVSERNGVVHGDAIAYAARMGVRMRVKNTFNPSAEGTVIDTTRKSDGSKPIIGISGKSRVSAVSVFDMGMADTSNYLATILSYVGASHMSISNIPTGEDRLKLIFNGGANEGNLRELVSRIQQGAISGPMVDVETIRNQGAVYLVGQELTNPLTYTRVLGTVATLLADNGLAMREVISHEKSPSLALTVKGTEVEDVITLLHSRLIA